MPKLKNFYSFSTWNSTGKTGGISIFHTPYKGVEMENSSERFSGLLTRPSETIPLPRRRVIRHNSR